MADKVGSSHGRSDNTQNAHRDPSPLAAGPGVSADVMAALRWVRRNPGIGLTHFKPENHRGRCACGARIVNDGDDRCTRCELLDR